VQVNMNLQKGPDVSTKFVLLRLHSFLYVEMEHIAEINSKLLYIFQAVK
jgi:hypothetical protein